MTGGFQQIEVELSALIADPDQQFLIATDRAGIAFVVRDGASIVGFSMHSMEECNGQILARALLTQEVHAAIICEKMRAKLALPYSGADLTFTIAICTKDRPKGLSRLLDSLLPLKAGTPVEVLVVDNAPSDAAACEVVEARYDVRYVLEPKPGLNFARNRALAEASGKILAFLDDDVIVDHNYFFGLKRAWCQNPDAGAVTGLVMPLALETEAQVIFEQRGGFRRGFYPLRFGQTSFRDPIHPCGAGKFGAGANMSFDVELVRNLGGFDEALDTGKTLPGGGDLDMFYRVIRSGRMLVYEPQAAVYHEHRRGLRELKRQYYTWGLGFVTFVAKTMRHDPAMKPALRRLIFWWLGYQTKLAVSSLFGRQPTPLHMILCELWGGLKGYFGEYGRSKQRTRQIQERQP